MCCVMCVVKIMKIKTYLASPAPPPPSPQEKNLEMKACHTHISIIFYLALATLSKLSLCYYDFFVMFIFKFVNAYFLNFA